MDISLVLLIAVQLVFVSFMTKLGLDYRRARLEREASAMSLTTGELKRLIEEAVQNATAGLEMRMGGTEAEVARLQERIEAEVDRRLLEPPGAAQGADVPAGEKTVGRQRLR
jgi:hypothetical protein